MKKNYIILLSAIIVVIISLVLVLCINGSNNKEDKKGKNNQETATEKKYKVDDLVVGELGVSNINVELFEDYTIVNFELKNNSSETYPEGNIDFIVIDSNVDLETVSSYVSAIEPNASVDVELVLDDVYPSIDAIKINK